MADVKVTLNRRALGELLRSDAVRRELQRRTDQAAAAAGPGYESDSTVGSTRAMAMVRPATPKARADNARNHTLMRVRDELRG